MITRCVVVANTADFVRGVGDDVESVNSTTGANGWRGLHRQRILRIGTRRDQGEAIKARQMFVRMI